MARERYLIGVDPEELKPSPPPPPEKPAGWWENLWYHYKWHLIVGGFVALLVILGIVTLATKNDPDYTVVLLTEKPLTTDMVDALQDKLAAVGEDIDGDGEVEVLIENLALGIDYSNQKIANDNTLVAHFAAGDVLLYATEPAYYEKKFVHTAADGYDFFTLLSDGQPYVRWHPAADGVAQELYIGVRNATGTAEKNNTHDQCQQLVERLLAQERKEGSYNAQ